MGAEEGPQSSKLTPDSSTAHQGYISFFFILSVLADAMMHMVKSENYQSMSVSVLQKKSQVYVCELG